MGSLLAGQTAHRRAACGRGVLRSQDPTARAAFVGQRAAGTLMKPPAPKRQRSAIYTRKSTEYNLDLAFNSLHAQHEACEAYIKTQTVSD